MTPTALLCYSTANMKQQNSGAEAVLPLSERMRLEVGITLTNQTPIAFLA